MEYMELICYVLYELRSGAPESSILEAVLTGDQDSHSPHKYPAMH